jgi:hypothetical protein
MDNTTLSALFAQAVESLLQGHIICEYSNEELHRYISNDTHFQDIDNYLRRIGRVLRKTMDGAAFFAAYHDLDAPGVKTAIRRQFTEVINELEPLVRWLEMVRSARKMDRTLQAGDAVRESQLLEPVEQAPALREELEKLSRSKLLANNNNEPGKQMRAVLKRLCDHGYLVPRGTQYIATGRWSRLYDLMEFISTHEQLDADETDSEQQELIL